MLYRFFVCFFYLCGYEVVYGFYVRKIKNNDFVKFIKIDFV